MNCERCGKTLRGGPRFPFHTLELSHNQSARTLGISGSTWQDYMCHGVGREAAERIADKMGVHVYGLWPELVDHDLASQHRECEDCGQAFLPATGRQRFCTRNCAARAWQRRKYQSDEWFRQRDIEKRRAYYQENGDYCRRWQRAYRERLTA